MKIPLYFLGTGQAIPTAKRNHTAILLSYGSENILIDCGEGTQRQFRKMKLNPCKLTRILLTHWHGDHVLGLPGLLQTLALNNYNRTLHIYMPKGTKHYLDLIYRLFVFQGKIKIQVEEVEGKFLETNDFILEARSMSHGAPCLAYSFIEKEKLRINKEKLHKYKIKGKIISQLQQGKDIIWEGKKISAKSLTYSQPKKKITFILDTARNESTIKLAQNSTLLITEATYTEKEKELAREYKHLTASQAAEIAKKSKSKKLILTHLSQRYEHKEKIILQEAKKIFKNVSIAEDLQKVEI